MHTTCAARLYRPSISFQSSPSGSASFRAFDEGRRDVGFGQGSGLDVEDAVGHGASIQDPGVGASRSRTGGTRADRLAVPVEDAPWTSLRVGADPRKSRRISPARDRRRDRGDRPAHSPRAATGERQLALDLRLVGGGRTEDQYPPTVELAGPAHADRRDHRLQQCRADREAITLVTPRTWPGPSRDRCRDLHPAHPRAARNRRRRQRSSSKLSCRASACSKLSGSSGCEYCGPIGSISTAGAREIVAEAARLDEQRRAFGMGDRESRAAHRVPTKNAPSTWASRARIRSRLMKPMALPVPGQSTDITLNPCS